MNRNSSIALFGAVFVVAVGLMGANGVFSMSSGIIGTSGTNYHENAGNLLGHVTLVAQDPSGNIKAYRQMDNVVTQVGRTCTAVLYLEQFNHQVLMQAVGQEVHKLQVNSSTSV